MNEQYACAAIILWAKGHFAPEINDPEPDVKVLAISYDQGEDEWEVELEVSTSANNPHVTFWLDDVHALVENRLHIVAVEY